MLNLSVWCNLFLFYNIIFTASLLDSNMTRKPQQEQTRQLFLVCNLLCNAFANSWHPFNTIIALIAGLLLTIILNLPKILIWVNSISFVGELDDFVFNSKPCKLLFKRFLFLTFEICTATAKFATPIRITDMKRNLIRLRCGKHGAEKILISHKIY